MSDTENNYEITVDADTDNNTLTVEVNDQQSENENNSGVVAEINSDEFDHLIINNRIAQKSLAIWHNYCVASKPVFDPQQRCLQIMDYYHDDLVDFFQDKDNTRIYDKEEKSKVPNSNYIKDYLEEKFLNYIEKDLDKTGFLENFSDTDTHKVLLLNPITFDLEEVVINVPLIRYLAISAFDYVSHQIKDLSDLLKDENGLSDNRAVISRLSEDVEDDENLNADGTLNSEDSNSSNKLTGIVNRALSYKTHVLKTNEDMVKNTWLKLSEKGRFDEERVNKDPKVFATYIIRRLLYKLVDKEADIELFNILQDNIEQLIIEDMEKSIKRSINKEKNKVRRKIQKASKKANRHK